MFVKNLKFSTWIVKSMPTQVVGRGICGYYKCINLYFYSHMYLRKTKRNVLMSMKPSTLIMKFIVHGSGVLAPGWGQYGHFVARYLIDIFFCSFIVVGDKVMHCYCVYNVLRFNCEIHCPGHNTKTSDFYLSWAEGDTCMNIYETCIFT